MVSFPIRLCAMIKFVGFYMNVYIYIHIYIYIYIYTHMYDTYIFRLRRGHQPRKVAIQNKRSCYQLVTEVTDI